MTSTSSEQAGSAFAPLRVSAFRALWIAALVSNIGSWMQTVGAQWFLVENNSSPIVIALVQSASAAPILLLGIPAGVLGEFVNRRSLLIVVQAAQVVIGLVLTVLTATGAMTPALLLGLTFLLGAASAVQLPAYQAIVPDIVPRALIPQAASLSSISVNIARALGPAIAGVAIAGLGVPFVFALNAATFAFFLLVVVFWRGYHPPEQRVEPFVDGLRAGLRYVANSGVVRRILLRLGLFIVPASALFALLPLIASGPLGLDSGGYGLLLTAIGGGSIAGAFVLTPVVRRIGINSTVLVASVVFGLGLAAIAAVDVLAITVVVLVIMGLAWIAVLASLNGAVQSFLPVWVRTRGLSIYQIVLFGSTAAGSALAGAGAALIGVTTASLVAGGLVLLVALSQVFWPFLSTADKGRASVPLPLTDVPMVDQEPIDEDAPTLVLVRYTVPAASRREFFSALERLGRSRRRTGARQWQAFDDRERPGVVVEAFWLGSWREHLAQHDVRSTEADDELIAAAKAFSTAPVEVEHLTRAAAN
ncbi:MFS transporter [Antiquaquibacter oligotrophicus]|nr:MFS transporter [Antiquaquibacter oligotrophicus]UDF12262.1 MFS transporter [Antiquaquibacter oligotrophicus]